MFGQGVAVNIVWRVEKTASAENLFKFLQIKGL
jgi:hypothetical protein